MDNLSTMLPTLGSPGSAPHSGPALDMGGMGAMIPGFDVVQKLFLKFGLDPSFLVTLGMTLTLLSSLLSFFTYSFTSLTAFGRFISDNLVSSATIHSSDVTYLYIMRWLAEHKHSTDCRLFCVTSRKNMQSLTVRRYHYHYGERTASSDDEDDDLGLDDDPSDEDKLGPKLKYTPAPGMLYFWYHNRPIIINRTLDLSYYSGDIPDETITVTTIGRSPGFLRDLLNEARRGYLEAQSRKTLVYTLSAQPYQKTWDQGRHRPSRDISTVIMPPVEKKNLIQDAMDYLNPQTMLWYVQRGLPYRRGYLFYGPPGTGKTSLSLALAGELNLPLYILSLSTGSLSDETLTMLFVGLPRKCIVLLEDIDCAGVYREGSRQAYNSDSDSSDSESDYDVSEDGSKDGSTKAKTQSKSKEKGKDKDKGGDRNSQPTRRRRPSSSVSFSGLLNAIDGVASHEGRILIMTTNHRERLDPALIRPGRVDLQVEFGHADGPALAEIFRELYKEIGPVKNGAAAPSSNEKESERDHVPRLAEAFAQRIPEGRFTPAEIQGYLQGYKGQPEKALDGIEAWVFSKTKVEREKKARKEAKKARLEETKLKEAAAIPTKNEEKPADRIELVEKLAGTFTRDGEVDSKAFEDFVECIRAAVVHYENKKVNGAHSGKANGHINGHVNGKLRGKRVNNMAHHTPGVDSTDDEL